MKRVLTESETMRELIDTVNLKNIVEFEEIEDDMFRQRRRKAILEACKNKKKGVNEEVAEFEEIEDDFRSRRSFGEDSHGRPNYGQDMSEEEQDAYYAGMHGFHNGERFEDNPYPEGPLNQAWAEGWNEFGHDYRTKDWPRLGEDMEGTSAQGIYSYEVDYMGHITIHDGTGRDVYIQGDDARNLRAELDRVTTQQQLQDVLSAYSDVMETHHRDPDDERLGEVAEFEEIDDRPMRRGHTNEMSESIEQLDEKYNIASLSYEDQLKLLQQHPELIGRIQNPSDEMQQLAVSINPQAIRQIQNPSETAQVKALSQQPELIHGLRNPTDWAHQVARHHSAKKGSMREHIDIVEWGNSAFKKYADRGTIFPEPIEGETVDNSLRRYLDAKPMKVTTDITESQMTREYNKFKKMK